MTLAPLLTGMASLAAVLTVAGCTQGPDFHPPSLAEDETTSKTPASTAQTGVAGGESQTFVPGQDLPAQWWHLFASSELDELIRLALDGSPDLRSAQAALRQAEDNLQAGSGVLLPQVTGTLNGARQIQGPGAAGGRTSFYNVFNADVSVSYVLDIFGGEKRAIEALAAQVDYQKYQLAGTYLTLTTNVVTTAVQLAAVQDQIQATEDIIASEQRQLELVTDQFAVGAAARAEVLAARAQLETTEASLPELQKTLEIDQNALAALIGRAAGKAPAVQLSLANFTLPQELPLSLPSALVRQRPDIRAQEALLHVASAQVGVAMANQFPQVTLSGNAGSQSPHVADFLGENGLFLGLAGGLVQPLFDAGQREAVTEAAQAAYAMSEAQYRGTVLYAFKNVADCLTALRHDALALRSTYAALLDSKASVDLTQDRYAAGTVAYAELLVQQQQYQHARIAYLRTLASRYSDTAALFQALGGGWWHDPLSGDAKGQDRDSPRG
jgi:NodT family efflux transporter outer membrane factor (OMF) lipoprotein